MKLIDLLKGKKTYLIALVFLVLVAIPLVTGKVIPEQVYGILAGLGLAFFRLAIQKVSENKGWRTYAAAVLTIAISLVTALGVVVPPSIVDMVYGIATVLGIVGVRKAVADLMPAMH